jgi:hypothetical protein
VLEAVGAFVRENRFVCNVTMFQVDLTEVEGTRAFYLCARGLLSAWQGALYLRGQGACYLCGQGAFYLCGQGPSICGARGQNYLNGCSGQMS